MSAIVERFSDVIVPVTDGLAVAFLFVLGANLGSFLNVLAHRLPRGLSVVRGGSRCPACGAAIRWHDNVPVVGWLALGGRCRDCRVGIPSRYPLVEAACAVLVGGVASVELLTGGATLPGAAWQRCRKSARSSSGWSTGAAAWPTPLCKALSRSTPHNSTTLWLRWKGASAAS
jgi:hypothetical protein